MRGASERSVEMDDGITQSLLGRLKQLKFKWTGGIRLQGLCPADPGEQAPCPVDLGNVQRTGDAESHTKKECGMAAYRAADVRPVETSTSPRHRQENHDPWRK